MVGIQLGRFDPPEPTDDGTKNATWNFIFVARGYMLLCLSTRFLSRSVGRFQGCAQVARACIENGRLIRTSTPYPRQQRPEIARSRKLGAVRNDVRRGDCTQYENTPCGWSSWSCFSQIELWKPWGTTCSRRSTSLKAIIRSWNGEIANDI
jgi:hypothetical protein